MLVTDLWVGHHITGSTVAILEHFECLYLASVGDVFQVVMEFRNGDQHVGVLLPRLSVAIMSAESRYEWSHGITPRLADVVQESHSSSTPPRLTLMKRGVRTSLTFRTVLRSSVCHCSMQF